MINNNVSIGSTSVAGWTTSFTAFISAGIIYLTGAQTAQEVTAVEVAGMGLLTLVITQVFRYLQAHKLINVNVAGAAESFENAISLPPESAATPEGPKVAAAIPTTGQ
jgi:hypothetical protein